MAGSLSLLAMLLVVVGSQAFPMFPGPGPDCFDPPPPPPPVYQGEPIAAPPAQMIYQPPVYAQVPTYYNVPTYVDQPMVATQHYVVQRPFVARRQALARVQGMATVPVRSGRVSVIQQAPRFWYSGGTGCNTCQ